MLHIIHIIQYSVWSVGVLILLGLVMRLLAKHHPEHLRTSVYFYCMAFCWTVLAIIASVRLEWFSDEGYPITLYGQYLVTILNFFIAIDEEAVEMVAIFCVVCGPSLLSYVICGLFGVAQQSAPVGWITRFLALFYAKSVLTFSAIGLPLLSYGAFTRWDGAQTINVGFAISMSLSLSLFSIVIITVISCRAELAEHSRRTNSDFHEAIASVHRWLIRKVPQSESEVPRIAPPRPVVPPAA
ncbi:hypothetical protein [Acetobacter fallax]|uniref:Uncharacterized protein n=1 Tax=Acetobacter fallax TaxID=1737473 RepID=A0ABX0KC36_9PROT|nr:hypothetical protein [Acetobacter fallax]NHO32733.1 hypothetical protein [Acetobacter fallax]NHO36295.1 hypothetical protein [Acetobacter fallax]